MILFTGEAKYNQNFDTGFWQSYNGVLHGALLLDLFFHKASYIGSR